MSNDDGITAPGLAALVAAVRDLGEIVVAAPDSPQSAAAHSITLKEPLGVEYVRIAGPGGLEGMAISGRPADCVRLAIRNLMDGPPDLVLSGINAGANVGVNIFYSGTVAAAAEGAMCGAPAVAFSAAVAGLNEGDADFVTVAGYCRRVLDRLLADGLEERQLINVNVPLVADEPPRGIRLAEQSDADVIDTYRPEQTPTGATRFHLAAEYAFDKAHPDSDVALLAERYVTVTPLHVDITCHERMAALHALEEDFGGTV
ncbi:MAG: 5'/3'-nucleotidase SurE [Planctomycetes bacterium]|nr:5'/3'-nucleotidase SurE [Phycisphaerae bacterium]NBB96174.1 5'/3'-nucleotidase SurE [Planctomycetota bacterium]